MVDRVVAILVAAFLAIPSVMVIPASLTDMTYLSMPKQALSVQHYVRFIADSAWIRSFGLSLGTALTAAVMATIVGTAFSIGAWKMIARIAAPLRAVMILPIAVPGVVAAVALYLLWTRLGLYDTIPGVILVQAIVGLPFVVITTSTGLIAMDVAQVRASRSLGAGPVRTLFRVVLPGIRGSVFAGFILALVSGWDESVITLFVTGRNVQVLPRKIWDSLRYDIDPIVAVVATIMLVLTTIGVIAYMLVSHRVGAARERRD